MRIKEDPVNSLFYFFLVRASAREILVAVKQNVDDENVVELHQNEDENTLHHDKLDSSGKESKMSSELII